VKRPSVASPFDLDVVVATSAHDPFGFGDAPLHPNVQVVGQIKMSGQPQDACQTANNRCVDVLFVTSQAWMRCAVGTSRLVAATARRPNTVNRAQSSSGPAWARGAPAERLSAPKTRRHASCRCPEVAAVGGRCAATGQPRSLDVARSSPVHPELAEGLGMTGDVAGSRSSR